MISSMRSTDRWVAGGLVSLLLLALAVYWPGVHGPFLFDDYPNLKNLAELNGHPTWRSIGVYLSLFPGVPGRPLATLSFLINDVDWPSDPYGFKITNLLIHLFNGVLVFGLARALGAVMRGANQTGGAAAKGDIAALACTALWLLSPIQVSAVFLTVQRMTELAATFAFAGLWAFVALLARVRSTLQMLVALAALALGTLLSFLCKENGALTPTLALVTCGTILYPHVALLVPRARRLMWAALLLPTLAVGWVLLQRVLHAPTGPYTGRNFGLWERVLTEGRVLLDYGTLIIAPRLSSSSLYNDDYQISQSLIDPVTTLFAACLIVGLLVAAFWVRRRRPLFAFAILWFLAGHVIESTVVALEIYFEHRNYLPLFGPAFAVAHVAVGIKGKLLGPVRLGLAVWLVMAIGITTLQARTWGNEERLATFWHLEHPTSLRAQQQYAQYLLKNGRPEEAREAIAGAEQQPRSAFDSMVQLLTLDCDAGKPITLQRVDQVLKEALTARHTPGTALILARLRTSAQEGRCPGQLSGETWLQITAESIRRPNGRGIARMIRVERAEFFLAAGRLDDAIAELDRAYGRRKTEPRVAFYAAALLATVGRYDEAREWAVRPLQEPWSWKKWLAQTDRQAKELVAAIDSAQRQSRR